MTSFQKKLEKILRESKTPAGQVLKEDQDSSPTRVHPEKGQDVTHGTIDGTGKIDATGPIKHTGDSTLKTQPGDTTGGPTGHIPGNSDLPRPQQDGLDKDNKNPGKKSYGLHEEGKDEDKEKVEEGKLPPFIQKKKDGDKDDDSDDKKEKKEVKEEKDEDEKPVEEELDHEEGDKSESKLKTEEKEEKDDEKDDKKAVAEATSALFKGEKLSEAFKEKTSTIFEATLSLRLKEYRQKLNERFNAKLNERVEEIREELAESVNGHLDLVVESWVKQNEVPLEKAIKAELVEDFIGGLKSLLEEHYIELPEDKVDVVVEMANKLENIEQKLNEAYETNANLNKKVKLYERTEVFSKVSKGLAATQVEKLKSLAESIEFKTVKQFETALTTLKESVDSTPNNPPAQKKTLAEQTLEQNPESTSSSRTISSVKDAMARMAKK